MGRHIVEGQKGTLETHDRDEPIGLIENIGNRLRGKFLGVLRFADDSGVEKVLEVRGYTKQSIQGALRNLVQKNHLLLGGCDVNVYKWEATPAGPSEWPALANRGWRRIPFSEVF